jgi:putative DNA primase/helicase
MMEETIIDSDDVVQSEVAAERCIMKPWLKPESLTLLYGAAGVGKTFFCLSVGIAVTRKLQIGKWAVENPVGCLYIEGEMTTGEIQSHLKALTKDLPPVKEPLRFLTSEDMARKYNIVPNLTDKNWRDAISDMVRENHNIGLLILDNVSSLAPNINENVKKDWDDINQWLISLKHLKKAVIIIHHAGINGNQRGSTGRIDNVTNAIKLKDLSGASDDHRAAFEVTFTKKRSIYGKDAEPFCMVIKEDVDSGLPWTIGGAIGQNRKPYIIALIGLGMKQREIAEALGCTEANVSQIKKKAINEGLFNGDSEPTDKWFEIYKGDTIENVISEYKDN